MSTGKSRLFASAVLDATGKKATIKRLSTDKPKSIKQKVIRVCSPVGDAPRRVEFKDDEPLAPLRLTRPLSQQSSKESGELRSNDEKEGESPAEETIKVEGVKGRDAMKRDSREKAGPKFFITIDGLDAAYRERLERRLQIEDKLKKANILVTASATSPVMSFASPTSLINASFRRTKLSQETLPTSTAAQTCT